MTRQFWRPEVGQKCKMAHGASASASRALGLELEGDKKCPVPARAREPGSGSEAAGWGETPITPRVSRRGLRKKSAARCCWWLGFTSPSKSKEEERYKVHLSLVPKAGCLLTLRPSWPQPNTAVSVTQTVVITAASGLGAWRVWQAERDEHKGTERKRNKENAFYSKWACPPKCQNIWSNLMLKKDSKINSWNMNSLQMKVISWTGGSRQLLMQQHRGWISLALQCTARRPPQSAPPRVRVFFPARRPHPTPPHPHSPFPPVGFHVHIRSLYVFLQIALKFLRYEGNIM